MELKKMKIISYIWGSVLLILVGGLTGIGFVYKNKIKKYEELENKLADNIKIYVDEKFIYPEEGKNIKITYQELKSNDAIDNLNIEDEECDGYGIVLHDKNTFKYETYIKCKEYKTKNYDKNLS